MHLPRLRLQRPLGSRDVGSISNLGGTTLGGHFFLKKKGPFSKIKRALLCLLQNLGGHVPRVLLCLCLGLTTSLATV